MDDSQVSVVDEATVLGTEAFLLFYAQRPAAAVLPAAILQRQADWPLEPAPPEPGAARALADDSSES